MVHDKIREGRAGRAIVCHGGEKIKRDAKSDPHHAVAPYIRTKCDRVNNVHVRFRLAVERPRCVTTRVSNGRL